jgi:hypothetical protein
VYTVVYCCIHSTVEMIWESSSRLHVQHCFVWALDYARMWCSVFNKLNKRWTICPLYALAIIHPDSHHGPHIPFSPLNWALALAVLHFSVFHSTSIDGCSMLLWNVSQYLPDCTVQLFVCITTSILNFHYVASALCLLNWHTPCHYHYAGYMAHQMLDICCWMTSKFCCYLVCKHKVVQI